MQRQLKVFKLRVFRRYQCSLNALLLHAVAPVSSARRNFAWPPCLYEIKMCPQNFINLFQGVLKSLE